ncbi:MAG: chorismate synthase [Ginsengibacter sp.]
MSPPLEGREAHSRMNSFGRILRVHIFGESHGDYVGVNIDGCPPGIVMSVDDFIEDLERRKPGAKGTTPRKEDDIPQFINGVFNDKSTGAPITILFTNSNIRSADYEKQRAIPRPGHADFVAHEKFGGFEDYRGGGHFSGRLTVAVVAAGVVAKKIIGSLDKSGSSEKKINIKAHIVEIGGEQDIEKGLQKAIDEKDSIGGIVECRVNNLPIGLGEPFFDSVESLLSHAVFSIPAVKGIEFGSGFAAAKMFGSNHNDVLINADGTNATNNAGGIVGGLTNGNDLVFRIAIKPTSSTPKEQLTLNVETGDIEPFSVKGRHDLCIALRVPVVLESVTAIVLADLLLIDKK